MGSSRLLTLPPEIKDMVFFHTLAWDFFDFFDKSVPVYYKLWKDTGRLRIMLDTECSRYRRAAYNIREAIRGARRRARPATTYIKRSNPSRTFFI